MCACVRDYLQSTCISSMYYYNYYRVLKALQDVKAYLEMLDLQEMWYVISLMLTAYIHTI